MSHTKPGFFAKSSRICAPHLRCLFIDCQNRSTTRAQERRNGNTRFAHTDDCNFLSRQFHIFYRNFSVLIASSASKIEMIQNLTITFGSAHPLSSKW